MLASVPLAASTQNAAANHKFWHKVGKGLAIGAGVGIGLGVVNRLSQPRQPTVVYQQPAPVYVAPAPVYQGGGFSQAHYNWCYSKYRSYDAPSNTYQPYSGPRRPCYSGR